MRWWPRRRKLLLFACPCDNWTLEIDIKLASPEAARVAVEEHERECIILAATHITVTG